MKYNRISVIISTRNLRKQLLVCLESIRKQSTLPHELVLVEDISENKYFSQSFLDNFFSNKIKVKYFSKEFRNRTLSKNLAIKNVTGDILLFTDHDTILNYNLIETVIKLYKKHPGTAAFVGKVLPYQTDAFSKFGSKFFMHTAHPASHPIKIIFYAGSTFSIKKSVLKKNKLFFNPKYSRSGDEIDLFARLNKHGEKILFHPDIVTQHQFKNTPPSFFRTFFLYALDYADLLHDHPKHVYIDNYFPHRMRHIILFPLFIPFQIIKQSNEFVKRYELDSSYYIPTLLYFTASFSGIYCSTKGRKILKERLKNKIYRYLFDKN